MPWTALRSGLVAIATPPRLTMMSFSRQNHSFYPMAFKSLVMAELKEEAGINVRANPFVYKAMGAGAASHAVVFDNDGPFMQDKTTGDVFPVRREAGTYKFRIRELKPGSKVPEQSHVCGSKVPTCL